MDLNIAICDDEPQQIHVISSYLNTYEIEYDDNFKVSAFGQAQSLLEVYKKSGTFDIMFLDVEMPDISGLELAKNIRSLPDRNVKIIFISNYPEYMQDSFEVQAFYYLNKPVSYEDFKRTMKRIIKEFSEHNFSKLLVGDGKVSELVDYSDILYFETVKGERSRIRLVLTDGSRMIKAMLSEYENILKDNAFFSPHRSYLVNLRHIHLIKKDCIVLDNGVSLPLSRRREKELKKLFTRQVLSIHQNNY